MKKVLVTGGAGFIGSHVADAFLDRGDRVWIVDDLSTGRRENVPAEASFTECDINSPALRQVFEDAGGFDIVTHHAAQMDVRRSVEDPLFDARVNILGLLNVLECAVKYGTGRFLLISSGGVVYGEPDTRPTPEASDKRPASPYGVSKLTAELYLQCYQDLHGLDYAALRYANIYGPRQDPHGEAGVVAIFCNRIAAGEGVTVYGDGAQTRDYAYVGDVVSANLVLAEATLPAGGGMDERAFNVGTSRETSVLELANSLMRAAGREVPVHHAPERAGELRFSCLDASKLHALGWEPRTDLEQGLRATYDFVVGGGTR